MDKWVLLYRIIDLAIAMRNVGFVLPKDNSQQLVWGNGLLQFLKSTGVTPQQIVDAVNANGGYTFKGYSGQNELYFVLTAAQMELFAEHATTN